MAKELSAKPADKYQEKFEKNGVWAHVRKMKKHELRQYYDRVDSKFYDVYYVAITNKSDKNVILSVPDTSVTTKGGKQIIIGNNLSKLMKKGNNSLLKKTGNGIGILFLGVVTWGLAVPAFIAAGDSNPLQKTKEIYYQTTYDKGLQSIVLPPYYTAVGFLVVPDKPFHSYKSVNFKFQKTQKLEYFNLEYPMELTTDKLRKERQKAALKLMEQKRKEAEKHRKEKLKLKKQKYKNL